jgi:hypothetical protein
MVKPTPSPRPDNVTHELTKAVLFIRVAGTAVTNLKVQIDGSKMYILYASVNGNYNDHVEFARQMDIGMADFKKWQERLLEPRLDS